MNLPPPFSPYYQPSSPFTSLPPPSTPPPLASPHLQPQPEIAAPNLSTALSALTSLLRLTETTLNSLSPSLPTPPSSALIPCPFNPRHLLPHSSLFSHYLSCPSSRNPISDPHSLLRSLHYPHNLHSTPINSFTQFTKNSTSTELSFSLQNFLNIPRNFFYSDCPAAVIVDPSNPNDSSSPMLRLPELLSAECADFEHNCGSEEKGLLLDRKIFPSEIWAVRNEMEGWFDYPSSYSCRVLRAILNLCENNSLCLLTWIIENSPKYGMVIDLAMRDHIFLLLKLCLKAIVREAIGLSDFLANEREDRELSSGEKIFDCPVLMKVMKWLGSRLTVLYGEVGGKSFTINMLKQCVLESALNSSCIPVVEKSKETSEPNEVEGNIEGAVANSRKDEGRSMMDESVRKCTIFVCQVAAAVSALYERYWLEEKITMLRDSRQYTAYQRFLEHENISNSAHEERQKRCNYRPIIEHDGVLSKRTHNQEPNRIKTAEELLAEERDYKRRRMSYRGKKIKRTTLQVTRDIIDEFMDEIKLAGGLANETEGAEATAFGSSSVHDIASDVLELTKDQSTLDGHRSKNSRHNYPECYEKDKRDSFHRENVDNDRSGKRERRDRKDNSKSLYQQKSDQHLRERSRHRGKRDDSEVPGETTSRSHRREGSRHDSEHRQKHERKKHKDRRSDSVHADYEDRYDPSHRGYHYEYDA